jgi:hypothetical protein
MVRKYLLKAKIGLLSFLGLIDQSYKQPINQEKRSEYIFVICLVKHDG